MVEERAEVVGRRALLAQQVEDQPGVERPRARAHDHALERREAHRGVDAAAVADRGERAARAEVAGDQPQLVERPAEQVRGPVRRVLVVDAVEAVAAQPALEPLVRAGVGVRGAARGRSGTRCRTRRPAPASPNRSSATATPSSPAALCSGAEAVSARTAALTSSVSGAGARKRAPPCTIRWPTTAIRRRGAAAAQQRARRRAAVARVPVDLALPHGAAGRRERRARLDVVEGRLQRARPGVERECLHAPGHVHSSTSGMSMPCSCMYCLCSMCLSRIAWRT